MYRTPNIRHHQDLDIEALVVDALAQLGVHAQPASGAHDRDTDLVIEADGPTVPIRLKRRALVDDEAARRLLAGDRSSAAALLVVGDRVTEGARSILTEAGAGYFDLRGRLALRTDRIVISADVPSVRERAERTDALAGKAGLEVATALLMQPNRLVAVRELARELKRSPSTVSEILAALRRDPPDRRQQCGRRNRLVLARCRALASNADLSRTASECYGM